MNKRNLNKQQNPFDDFPDKFFVVENEDESNIFHEKTFIGTELGGEGNRLRYYVIISTKNDICLSIKQQEIIADAFKKISQKYDSKIESIEFFETYALLKLLVSMNEAIGDVIDNGIIACNKGDKFLRFHYYATNTKKPTAREIQEYLQFNEAQQAT